MKMDQQETAAFFLPTGHGDDDDNDNTCFTGVAKIFQRGGVTLCQSEATQQIVMSFLPPVASCFLNPFTTRSLPLTSKIVWQSKIYKWPLVVKGLREIVF